MKPALFLAVLLLYGLLNTLSAQPSASTAGTQSAGVVLDKGWDSPLQGNNVSMKELASLLSPFFQPNANTSPDPSIEIYQGITYLMPWKEALKRLGITQSMPAKVQVVCPGFPKDSLYDFLFSGIFDGDYDQLHLITDSAGKVVSIELVCTKPKKRVTQHFKEEPWHTIDFVGNKTKAMSTVFVFHDIQFIPRATFNTSKSSFTTWSTYNPKYEAKNASVNIVRIESEAIAMKPHFTSPDDGRLMETIRWYVPKPLAELILFCARKNG